MEALNKKSNMLLPKTEKESQVQSFHASVDNNLLPIFLTNVRNSCQRQKRFNYITTSYYLHSPISLRITY